MKTLTIVSIIIFSFTLLFCGFDDTELDHDVFNWSDIGKTEKDSLTIPAIECIELLKNGSIKELWAKSHTEFQHSTPEAEFQKYADTFARITASSSEMELIDGKLIVCRDIPEKFERTFGGVPFISNGHYLEFYLHPYIQYQGILIYKFKKDNIGRFLVINLGKQDNIYKVVSINYSLAEVDGKDADFYAAKAEEWKKKLKYSIPTAFAYAFANKFSTYGKVAQGKMAGDAHADFQEMVITAEYIDEYNLWTVNDKRIVVLGIDVYEMNDSLVPLIYYVSNVSFEQKSLTEEARQFAKKLGTLYPEFAMVFPRIVVSAYEENPVDQNKQYETFTIPINFEVEE